jgi:hypothetical protein
MDAPNANVHNFEDFDQSWLGDLQKQGIDIDEFLNDVVPTASGDNSSSEPSSVLRRMSQDQRTALMERLSSVSSISSALKNQFSSFYGQSYELHPTTGDVVFQSPEDMERKKWEKEVEEDSRNFDPNGISVQNRERNRQWAISMARSRVAEAGFEPEKDEEEEEIVQSESAIETDIPLPPPPDPLPPVEEFNLASPHETSLGPQNIGIRPPSLPHKLSDVIPKLSRFDLVGITNGAVVNGSLEEAWATCDSNTMIVSCINNDLEKCDSFLRCPRVASLVRCPRCKTVSPCSYRFSRDAGDG